MTDFDDRGSIRQQSVVAESPKNFVESSDDRQLVVEVEYRRTPPIHLRTEPELSLRRVTANRFVADIPSETERPIRVIWVQPYSGAHVRAHEVQAGEATKPELSIVDRFSSVIQANSSTASTFWLRLDLATSFAETTDQRAKVAELTELDKDLLGSIDALEVESLKRYLDGRWIRRATCHRAGLNPRRHLPLAIGMSGIAHRVAYLIRELVLLNFERKTPKTWCGFDELAFFEACLQFASGVLRRSIASVDAPQNQQLNLEPNSLSIASFAELMDLVIEKHLAPSSDELRDYMALRVVFASMIEAYSHVYWNRCVAAPRQASRYSPENLERELEVGRDPRLSESAVESLAELYKSRTKMGESGRAWLLNRWGENLAFALRDDGNLSAV